MNGLKDHQIAALVSKVNDEMRERYANYGLPQSSRMTVKLAVEDYLSENKLRLDHKWSDSDIHEKVENEKITIGKNNERRQQNTNS